MWYNYVYNLLVLEKAHVHGKSKHVKVEETSTASGLVIPHPEHVPPPFPCRIIPGAEKAFFFMTTELQYVPQLSLRFARSASVLRLLHVARH